MTKPSTPQTVASASADAMAVYYHWCDGDDVLDPATLTLVTGQGEWSAVYQLVGDHKLLVDYGDHDGVMDKLIQRMGVTRRWLDTAITADGEGKHLKSPPVTFAEVIVYQDQRAERVQQAAALRAEAEKLLARAAELES